MPELTLYQRYTRKEARDLLDPSADYTPGAGTWGYQALSIFKASTNILSFSSHTGKSNQVIFLEKE